MQRLRIAKGWGQKQLADEVGCKRSTISSIELGYTANPGAEHVLGIANALGTTPEALYEEPKPEEAPALLDDLIAKLRVEAPVGIPIPMEDNSIMVEYIPRDVAAGMDLVGLQLQDEIYIGDKNTEPSEGDMALCTCEGSDEIHLGTYMEIEGEGYVECPHGRLHIGECSLVAVVVRSTKSWK